jgi:hypothetical protein
MALKREGLEINCRFAYFDVKKIIAIPDFSIILCLAHTDNKDVLN